MRNSIVAGGACAGAQARETKKDRCMIECARIEAIQLHKAEHNQLHFFFRFQHRKASVGKECF